MSSRAPRQGQLELSYRQGDLVWVKDGPRRLLARIRAGNSIQLVRGHQAWLVCVHYPDGWGEAEHRTVIGTPTAGELSTLRANGVLP